MFLQLHTTPSPQHTHTTTRDVLQLEEGGGEGLTTSFKSTNMSYLSCFLFNFSPSWKIKSKMLIIK